MGERNLQVARTSLQMAQAKVSGVEAKGVGATTAENAKRGRL